jgi:A/G-specific adenine glycosylase
MYNIHIPINSTKGVREFTKTAQKILNKTDPGLHNQAMMEFGALVCLPKTPKCNVCPFHLECVSRREGKEKDLPVKSRKTKKRQRFFLYTVFVNLEKEILFLRKRTDNDIWRNLYDFHLQEFSSAESLEEKIAAYSSEFKITQRQHLLSHQTINACFIIEKTLHTKRGFKGMLPIDLNELSEYPLPALIKKYIDDDLVHLYSLIR